jgi:hypothetical protein
MKLLTLMLGLSAVAALAQEPNNRHSAGSGKNYKQVGQVYVARTPYILQWHAEAKYNLYDKPSNWKGTDTTSCVTVYDADTRKPLYTTRWGPLKGSVSIPKGGRHYVCVWSLGRWHANIIEDAEMLKKAQREGYLTKDSILTPEARANSVVGKRESVQEASAAMIKDLEAEREKVAEDDTARQSKLNAIDEKIYLVKVAASRASDVADFDKRVAALIPAGK